MPFKKGKSGNGKKVFKQGNKAAVGHGSPKGERLSTTLKRIIEQGIELEFTVGGKKIKKRCDKESLIAALLKEAMNGKNRTQAIKEIFDRMEGKASQPIEVSEGIKLTINQKII